MKNLETPSQPISEEETDRVDMGVKIFTGFTKREQACITLGIPESGDPELDALILKSERKRIASGILSGVLSNHRADTHSKEALVEKAIYCADTLLEELSK